MSLSPEAQERFARVLTRTDPSRSDPADDAELLAFAAWSLVHEPEALEQRFSLDRTMTEHRHHARPPEPTASGGADAARRSTAEFPPGRARPSAMQGT